jgi:hypothetical protein
LCRVAAASAKKKIRGCREPERGSDYGVTPRWVIHEENDDEGAPEDDAEETTMKYILMMNTPSGGGYQIGSWPKKDIENHIRFMKAFATKLSAQGELVGAEGLAGPEQARLVRAGTDGKPITDGVFPETKEFLAGYWIVDVETPERAYAIAAEASTAPGPGGTPLYLNIEVRQVMSGPPKDLV